MSDTSSDQERLCPSARCEDGAVLVGVVGREGTIGYLSPRVLIDPEFVRTAKEGRSPERRFRFAQPCVEAGCVQWTGSQCGVIDRVMDEVGGGATRDFPLPKCSIRPDCRWFSQSGSAACRVCPLVITDLRREAASTPNAAAE